MNNNRIALSQINNTDYMITTNYMMLNDQRLYPASIYLLTQNISY